MTRTVTASGQGTARVVPDTAVVRAAATHRADGVKQAIDGVASTTEALTEVARRFTDAARIASTEFSIWPTHDGKGRSAGFEATHGLTVSLPDLTAAGGLLSAWAAEVGDRLVVEGVSLEVKDPAAAQAEARASAVADARRRAEHLATLNGASLGELVSIVEGSGAWLSREVTPMAASVRASDMSFEPGERSVSVTVTATWELT